MKKTYDARIQSRLDKLRSHEGQINRNELVVRLDAITELVGKIKPYQYSSSEEGVPIELDRSRVDPVVTILRGVQESLECVLKGLERK